MLILLLISFILCFGYIAYVSHKFDIASISESYYKFEEQKKGRGILFWLWTDITSFTLLPCWLEVSGEDYQFVAFLSATALIAIGCTPKYKDEHSLLHPLFTALCISLAVVWSILACTWYTLLLIPITFTWRIYLNKWKLTNLYSIKMMLWIEIAAFLSIYISVLIQLLQH